METAAAQTAPHLDESWYRGLLEELCSFPRETATEGEARAARWLVDRLTEAGAPARLEEELSNGGYWWPLGLAALAGLVTGWAARRGHRAAAVLTGASAMAAACDDLPPGGRRLRRVLPRRSAWNVVAELGPADAERTIVAVAHHDTAHSGLIFSPEIPETIDRVAPWALERTDTSPPLMLPVVGAPGVAALAALTGSRRLGRVGALLSAGVAAAMADIGSRAAVPGANDNGTGVVALIALARALAERPTERTRVILVSTSEEATCEGMHHFAGRHFPELPRESTFFLTLDTLGSPHLCVLRGEGMLRMREYPAKALDLVDGLAEQLGISLFPNLRLRNATDGIYPLAAGYPCATICSCTRLKQPANYHWPTDTPDNVDFQTHSDAVRLSETVVRTLDQSWL
jgi:Peptidase family M28